jgi:hypothetical protein
MDDHEQRIADIQQQVRDGLLRKSEGRRMIARLRATRKRMEAYAASVDQHRKTEK